MRFTCRNHLSPFSCCECTRRRSSLGSSSLLSSSFFFFSFHFFSFSLCLRPPTPMSINIPCSHVCYHDAVRSPFLGLSWPRLNLLFRYTSSFFFLPSLLHSLAPCFVLPLQCFILPFLSRTRLSEDAASPLYCFLFVTVLLFFFFVRLFAVLFAGCICWLLFEAFLPGNRNLTNHFIYYRILCRSIVCSLCCYLRRRFHH